MKCIVDVCHGVMFIVRREVLSKTIMQWSISGYDLVCNTL